MKSSDFKILPSHKGFCGTLCELFLEELPDVKEKQARQTVCNEPKDNPKEPYCGGKLKKVTALDSEAKKAAGKGKEVFRCQVCKTLYVEDSPYAAANWK